MFAEGELQSVDGYMNIALEKTNEYVNGRLRRNYGDAFVRGNNGSLRPSAASVLFSNSHLPLSKIQQCSTYPQIDFMITSPTLCNIPLDMHAVILV